MSRMKIQKGECLSLLREGSSRTRLHTNSILDAHSSSPTYFAFVGLLRFRGVTVVRMDEHMVIEFSLNHSL